MTLTAAAAEAAPCYATLDDLRRHLGLSAAQTDDDALLVRALHAAARLVDRFTGRHFVPLRATRRYSVTDPGLLVLDADLLTLHSLTNGDGSTLDTSTLHLIPAHGPAALIALDRTQAAFTHSGDPIDALALDGTWGYHPGWPDVWVASGDSVQDAPLSDTATTLTVSDADGLDPAGWATRFAVGQLLRIEDEYLHVVALDADANTLTVTRAANGTTAASHAQDTPISVYQPPDDIRQVTLRIASWLYKQRDAGFVTAAGGLRGQITVPPALPPDVAQILAFFTRVRVA